MSRQNAILFLVTLAMIAGAASLLGYARTHQRLAPPGVKTHSLPNSKRLQVDLPSRAGDYQAEPLDPEEITLNVLPKDTSFGRARYTAPDGFQVLMSVVLMGTDRTSMHKPQFCLTGDGWNIDQAASGQTSIHMEQPCSYDLSVIKLVATKEALVNGERQTARAVYVYWYVADDALSASVSGVERMWLMADRLLRTGVLQRWAYVSCFSICSPGQEDAAFARIKKFITESVPRFQLMPPSPVASASSSP